MNKKNFTLIAFVLIVLVTAGKIFAKSGDSSSLVYTEPYMVTLNPSNEMNIIWLTKDKCEGYVEYGETPALGKKAVAKFYEIKGFRKSATPNGYDALPENNPEIPVYQLIADIKNLTAGNVIYYRVTTIKDGKTETGERYFFKTAPQKGKDFDFALLSDMQLKVKTKETLKFLGQQQKDFILFAGDLSNTPWKVGEWINVDGCYEVPSESDRGFFECLSQNDENCHLMQYMPIFYCPGNHEVDDQRVFTDKKMTMDDSAWSWKIYMQLFRPLYPEQEYKVGGKRWYSVDYGDLHISSISVARWQDWDGFEFPGWRTMDDISPNSAQVKWLQNDLKNSKSKYKWIVMHWHMLNRGDDGYYPVSNPVQDPKDKTKAIYPDGDYCWDVLRPIYEKNGVAAVNFGHSHVYERYLINGVNYIEAASIGNNYRETSDPYHTSGNRPLVEENNFRSIMTVHVGKDGIKAKGIQASVEKNGIGYIGRVFDEFKIK